MKECACAPEELHQKMWKSDQYRSGVVQGHLGPVAGVFYVWWAYLMIPVLKV